LHKGSARITLDTEVVEVGAGALVFVGDPSVVKSVTALEAGTTMLTFGTNPIDFVVSLRAGDEPARARWSIEPHAARGGTPSA
jgi:hypothetical protein